jgi:hypothetical protein
VTVSQRVATVAILVFIVGSIGLGIAAVAWHRRLELLPLLSLLIPANVILQYVVFLINRRLWRAPSGAVIILLVVFGVLGLVHLLRSLISIWQCCSLSWTATLSGRPY